MFSKLNLLLIATIIAGCASNPPSPAPEPTPPVDQPIKIQPVPNPPEDEVVIQPVPNPPAKRLTYDPAVLDKIAASSSCAQVYFTKRGKPPVGYIKGMARMYAKALARYVSPETTVSGIQGGKVTLGPDKDVLALYGLDAEKGSLRLKNLYTLLIGLGMRESSGNYGEGRDMSAENTSAETAETGLFQFSWNLRSSSPMMLTIYEDYQKDSQECLENVFKEGVRKPFNNNYAGSGAGLDFQKFARRCPAMATDWTATAARLRVAHWGPLKRKEAEFRKECFDMLTKVEANMKYE